MRINFYDTRIEGCRTVLVKEKAVNYRTDDFGSPVLIAELLNSVSNFSLPLQGE